MNSLKLKEIKQELPQVLTEEIFSFLLPKSCLEYNDTTTAIDLSDHNDIRDINALLIGLCLKCPKLESLTISSEYESEHSKNLTNIDFGCLYMPYLDSLSISCIQLNNVSFNNHNFPNLESIDFENIQDDISKFNVLNLNKLKYVNLNYVFFEDSKGFEKFIWTCPNIENILTYKCRGLSQQIWYCPNIEQIELYRAECLESLIIVYAPKLNNLSIRAAYDCATVRVFNCKQLNWNIFKPLVEDYESKVSSMNEHYSQEWSKWENGTYGTKELIAMNIIDEEEVDEYGTFNEDDTIQQCVSEQLSYDMESICNKAYNDMITKIVKYNNINEMKRQPKIHVNCINMNINAQSFLHLKQHARIGEKYIETNEDEMNDMGMPMDFGNLGGSIFDNHVGSGVNW